MQYECMDCRWCANFNGGMRVICLHEEFPPSEVCKYLPVGDKDAYYCNGFNESWNMQIEFSEKDFTSAELYSEEKHGEVTYSGIREWCELEIESKKKKE